MVLCALLFVVGGEGLKGEGMFVRDVLWYAASLLAVYVIVLDGQVGRACLSV